MTRLDMTGASARAAKFVAATLREAILINANLSFSDMTTVQGVGLDLNGANLTGVNFSSATLTSARLTNANLTNAILNGANLTGANMKGAIVTGLKFNESTTWPDGKKGSQGNPVSYTT
ncbi:MAG: pentapeptide repeat-containing protein [Chloroflexi bacterium]|nr:pentapeptide repeat-containing protein [Chloroflexota bacterium]